MTKIKKFLQYAAGTASLAALLLATQHAASDSSDGGEKQAASLPANIAVIDAESGQLRAPTAEERAEMAERFSVNIDELRGKRAPRIPKGKQVDRNGVSSAVVGASHIQFLVAQRDQDGNLVVSHGAGSADISSTLPQEVDSKGRAVK